MKALTDLRDEIDAVDRELARLLARRFALTDAVASAKRQIGKAVLDAAREQTVRRGISQTAGDAFSDAVNAVYDQILALSRDRQSRLLAEGAL